MRSEESVAGRGFVVTGGSRGLGRELVMSLAARGADVVFCARRGSEAVARQVEEQCSGGTGGAGRVAFVPADVASAEDVATLFQFARARLRSIDAVVSNSGVKSDKLLVETPIEEWRHVVGVNLRGAWLVAREALAVFASQGRGGCLVQVSSVSANGSAGQCAYSATKQALLGMTRSIAATHGAAGVRCNAVVPGYLESEMTSAFSPEGRRLREELSPFRRFGKFREVIDGILFLCSSDSALVNGEALYVAGGLRDVMDIKP